MIDLPYLSGQPGGAVALAAVMTGKVDVRNKIAVAVLSGGNGGGILRVAADVAQ